ncbi:MAG TPA: hypothetical protein VGJ04_09465 [Pirellulales bacterium]
MKWFQFTLRRMMLLILFCCVGLAFTKAAFSGTVEELYLHVPLRFTYSLIAAAAFSAAVGTVFRNIYNGFAIGVYSAFLFYLLGFVGFVFSLK